MGRLPLILDTVRDVALSGMMILGFVVCGVLLLVAFIVFEAFQFVFFTVPGWLVASVRKLSHK